MYMVFITFYSNVFFLAAYILSPHLVIRLFEMADEAGGLEQGCGRLVVGEAAAYSGEFVGVGGQVDGAGDVGFVRIADQIGEAGGG
jgi:hypothetical protein